MNFIRYAPGASWGEFHWDHLDGQYGNILVCLQEADEGGATFMDAGKSRFQLSTGEAAAWLNYDQDGNLVREACHAAGAIWGNKDRVVLSLGIFFKRDFKAPSKTVRAEQARAVFPRVLSF